MHKTTTLGILGKTHTKIQHNKNILYKSMVENMIMYGAENGCINKNKNKCCRNGVLEEKLWDHMNGQGQELRNQDKNGNTKEYIGSNRRKNIRMVWSR